MSLADVLEQYWSAGTSQYRDDPVGFVEGRLGETVWSKQRAILESVRDNRRTAVQSCHGAGKSFIAARIAAWWMESWAPGEAFVVTTAPTGHQVKAILWKEMHRAHKKGKLRGRLNQTEWWLDDEIVAMGRKPADYDEQAFQGIHALAVLVIIDEACGIPQGLFDAAASLVTTDECRILAIGNPDDPSAHFAKICQPDSGWNTIGISVFDTPNFTGEPVPDHVGKLLVTQEWERDRNKDWGESSPLYIAKCLGVFPEDSEDSLITLSWAKAAAERTLEASRPHVLGVDVARFGSDKSEIYERQGPVVRHVWEGAKQDTMETAGRVAHMLRETEAQRARIDTVGIGAGVYDRLFEQGFEVEEMQAGSSPHDKDRFVMARDEWFWNLRGLFESGEIDIDPEDEKMIAQVTSIKWRLDSRGRIKIESKDDMAARGMPSPDRADAVAMAFADGHVIEGPVFA